MSKKYKVISIFSVHSKCQPLKCHKKFMIAWELNNVVKCFPPITLIIEKGISQAACSVQDIRGLSKDSEHSQFLGFGKNNI